MVCDASCLVQNVDLSTDDVLGLFARVLQGLRWAGFDLVES